MTDLDTYQPAGGIGQYQAGIVMTPETAKALDEQVRACTKAVLREGTDYGHIPGTGGDEKSLWRPGAQKLLQWFQLGCTCDRVEVERDDDGRKHGITYRAVVTRRLPDGTREILATCEGTADYDESKFYQSEEQVKARLRDAEHKWAAKDRRVPNADRWNSAKEYRADWNALMKRAQKRAIVGATVDATAAGGIFTDREEDDSPEPVTDNGPTWYEEALETALSFTDKKAGRTLYTDAAQAHRDGLCTRRQMDHIQNRVTQRARLLTTATPVDVEDLGPKTAAAGDGARSQRADGEQAPRPAGADEHGTDPAPAGDAPSREHLPPLPAEDQPGSASGDQLTALHITFGGLGFGSGDRDAKLRIAETITGRADLATSKNLSWTEARKLIDTLEGFDGDREKLIAFMAEREQVGDSDA